VEWLWSTDRRFAYIEPLGVVGGLSGQSDTDVCRRTLMQGYAMSVCKWKWFIQDFLSMSCDSLNLNLDFIGAIIIMLCCKIL